MKRNSFLKALGAGTIGLTGMQNMIAKPLVENSILQKKAYSFNLNYAPHLGMFSSIVGDNPIAQLHFIADQGFTAFEDNEMRNRPIKLQNEMASVIKERGLKMGVFVAHTIYWRKPNLASGDKTLRNKFLNEIKASIPVAKRVGAKWMTVVPGHIDPTQNMAYQTSHVVQSLREAANILEKEELCMVLEPLNFRDHPGLFLSESPQAYEICKAVNSDACKILFDIYHQQVQEGNLIPNINKCWSEIAYFQIGDNPGRNEPSTGEINYLNVFKHIHSKGYKGILGMEHGNSKPNQEGALAVIDAYKTIDNLL
tara:strand:+ start:27571 stop:28503 length:933 start_codon:yes stop_codon:yes gene_type:complete